jgi:flagellar protein FlgJ
MSGFIPLAPAAPLAPLSVDGAHDGPAPAPASDDALYRAKATESARKFESFFIGQMMKSMRAGTRAMADEGSVFKDKVNEDMQDLADSLVADQMAGQRAFGIADVILRQLLPAPAPAPVDAAQGLPFSAAPNPVASGKT